MSLCRLAALTRVSESQLTGWTPEVDQMIHGGTASSARRSQEFRCSRRPRLGTSFPGVTLTDARSHAGLVQCDVLREDPADLTELTG
jgi:hypothetical protein